MCDPRTSCSLGSRKNSPAYRLHAFLTSPSDKLLPARVMMAMRAWVLRFARRSRRKPCAWSGSCAPCLASYCTLFCRGASHPSSCQVHRRCPPKHQKVLFRVHPERLQPMYPGSCLLHLQWPHLRVPVRHRHPMLGLSACSKHVALVTELECA